MKYPASKVLIIIGSVFATAAVWGGLAWHEWTATPASQAAVVEAVATVAPPPPPVATEPPPAPVATPVVIHNIVYVPINRSESGDAPPPAAEEWDSAPAEPAPVYAPDPAPAPQPVVQQPAPQPVAPAPPPVAAPAPTPIVSEGS